MTDANRERPSWFPRKDGGNNATPTEHAPEHFDSIDTDHPGDECQCECVNCWNGEACICPGCTTTFWHDHRERDAALGVVAE